MRRCPLPSPPPTYIEHLEVVAIDLEGVLDDSGGGRARVQHVLLGGHVAQRGDRVDLVEEVGAAVVQLVLGGVAERLLDRGVGPQSLDMRAENLVHGLVLEGRREKHSKMRQKRMSE